MKLEFFKLLWEALHIAQRASYTDAPFQIKSVGWFSSSDWFAIMDFSENNTSMGIFPARVLEFLALQ